MMLHILDPLRTLTFHAVLIRMVLAFICGGIIGLEREYKRRPAGFRTHILICLGAAMTTLTSQYLAIEQQYYLDIARMGAQVVAGIGFIGAGTIIVTKRQRVKGLTTAAGLWTSAIVGLAVGMGFCEVGILVTAMVLLAEVIFSKVEYRLKANTPELNLFVGCENTACLEHMNKLLTQQGVIILNTQVVRADESTGNIVHAILLLRLPRGLDDKSLLLTIGQIPGVTEISEL